MSITARFWVQKVSLYPGFARNTPEAGYASPPPRGEVLLGVVSGNRAPENAAWASATPAGTISLTVGNPDAVAWFTDRLGKDVAVTIDDRDPAELGTKAS